MIYFEAGVTGTYGANNPRVLWNSATRRGTISASSEAAGFAAVNALSPYEYSYWQATSTAAQTLTLTLSPAETINAIGISQHNLGSTGATVQVQIDTGGGFASVGPAVAPTTDAEIVILLADRSATGVRLSISGGSAAPRIAVFYACQALEFPQRVYVDQGAPANMSRRTQFRTNETIAGKWSGRSIKRQRNQVDVPLMHISESWILANADPFFADARSYPYFLCPRPAGYPQDVQYKWMSSDIVPSRMGTGGNLMEFTL